MLLRRNLVLLLSKLVLHTVSCSLRLVEVLVVLPVIVSSLLLLHLLILRDFLHELVRFDSCLSLVLAFLRLHGLLLSQVEQSLLILQLEEMGGSLHLWLLLLLRLLHMIAVGLFHGLDR